MHWIVAPGFFANETVRVALVVGALVAVAATGVGVFVVLRGQSFAGHALTDVATAGGAGSFFFGATPLSGFVIGGALGAGAMDVVGVSRLRGRDFATGIVLGAATGLSALFFYLASISRSASGAAQQVLFGSLFSVSRSLIPSIFVLTIVVLLMVGLSARPLLLSSLSIELAVARGIRLRVVSLFFMFELALAVALSSLALGSILSTALLIGPAAIALRITRRLPWTFAISALIGIGATWIGTLLAYNSRDWTSSHTALPVSFFVVFVIVSLYVATLIFSGRRHPIRESVVSASPVTES